MNKGVITLPTIIKTPSGVECAGNKPKIIQEFIGRVNSSTTNISIAKMTSPAGWEEPGQTPEFDEYTLVLKGMLKVATKDKIFNVNEGQAIITYAGEWIRYSTPNPGGAEYVAICLPAFSPETVHRD
ncbi:MAG: cupin [Ignavibacteria bacterium]|nr:cupin [Ignavibacteria bacterium]